jgi:hypothetical protein
MGSGGSIEVTANGEGTSIRPGSWNGAKAQEGSPEDLRDPTRVHVRDAGKTGRWHNKARAWKEPPAFQERRGGHEAGGSAWAEEAKPISDR